MVKVVEKSTCQRVMFNPLRGEGQYSGAFFFLPWPTRCICSLLTLDLINLYQPPFYGISLLTVNGTRK